LNIEVGKQISFQEIGENRKKTKKEKEILNSSPHLYLLITCVTSNSVHTDVQLAELVDYSLQLTPQLAQTCVRDTLICTISSSTPPAAAA